ncbi:hypothetical protein ATANTOWER_032068 [Ataeniobius toweri]|uniref:Uncharacterized protein n=1 Tax=Ataeniobius toweri TaxID=208326 RepID=A0ABU7AUT1_9TELE|nr:hypothetical protein [Ataeniobius toweri]
MPLLLSLLVFFFISSSLLSLCPTSHLCPSFHMSDLHSFFLSCFIPIFLFCLYFGHFFTYDPLPFFPCSSFQSTHSSWSLFLLLVLSLYLLFFYCCILALFFVSVLSSFLHSFLPCIQPSFLTFVLLSFDISFTFFVSLISLVPSVLLPFLPRVLSFLLVSLVFPPLCFTLFPFFPVSLLLYSICPSLLLSSILVLALFNGFFLPFLHRQSSFFPISFQFLVFEMSLKYRELLKV